MTFEQHPLSLPFTYLSFRVISGCIDALTLTQAHSFIFASIYKQTKKTRNTNKRVFNHDDPINKQKTLALTMNAASSNQIIDPWQHDQSSQLKLMVRNVAIRLQELEAK